MKMFPNTLMFAVFTDEELIRLMVIQYEVELGIRDEFNTNEYKHLMAVKYAYEHGKMNETVY